MNDKEIQALIDAIKKGTNPNVDGVIETSVDAAEAIQKIKSVMKDNQGKLIPVRSGTGRILKQRGGVNK